MWSHGTVPAALFLLLLTIGEAVKSSAPTNKKPSHRWLPSFVSRRSSRATTDSPSVSPSTLQQGITNNITSNVTAPLPHWKQALPKELQSCRTLQRIIIPTLNQHIELYLLGTSHVSNNSNAHVSLLLDHVQPQVVFVELCLQRIPMLFTPEKEESVEKLSFWDRVKLVQTNKSMSKGSAIGTALLTQVQEDYADTLGVELGGEFRVAHEWCLAKKQLEPNPLVGGVTPQVPHFILGDRPLKLTLKRAWESLKWYKKMQLLMGLTWNCCFSKTNPQELQEWMESILNSNGDLLTKSIQELQKHFPTLNQVIIQERDAYMACKLHQTCQLLASLPKSSQKPIRMVAIVGAGHVQGIVNWCTNGNGQSPPEILKELIQTNKRHKKTEELDVEEDAFLQSLVTEVTELPY